ncbi:MAG: polyprenyl synthetase family protein [Candidatus Woesebacteria bacterium]|jgi:geranylgeranyl diphosphate synthase type I
MKKNSFNFLKEFTDQFHPFLLDFFAEIKEKNQKENQVSIDMIRKIEEFSLRGGKRLRPALLFLAFNLFSKSHSSDIYLACLSVELIHSFLLMQDDVMDLSTLRRGKSTLHKIYEQECLDQYKNKKSAAHFGHSMAILAGDLAYSLSLQAIFKTSFSPKLKLKVLKKLSQIIVDTLFGQELDIRLELKKNVQSKDILKVYELKTAKYTFEAPLQLGAILAGAEESNLRLLSDFALPCGIAFQISDDILGLFGKEDKTGKSNKNDIEQGKKTLLVAYALEHCKKKEKQFLNSKLGKNKLSNDEIGQVRAIITGSGSLAYCQKQLLAYLDQAQKILDKFEQAGWNKKTIDKLLAITNLLAKRTS